MAGSDAEFEDSDSDDDPLKAWLMTDNWPDMMTTGLDCTELTCSLDLT